MILIFPFSMRESINYAIRARLRGEYVIGAASKECGYKEYCDEFVILPSIYDDGFAESLRKLSGVKRFYTPHHLVYSHVKSLAMPWEFAEGCPIEIAQREFIAAKETGLPVNMVQQSSHIYGHMSEEKISGLIECFRDAPQGDCLEVGCGWGKSLNVLSMLCTGKLYAIDTWDVCSSIQKESHSIVRESSRSIDWDIMRDMCMATVPEAIYGLIPEEMAVLHIDANHDYESVRMDWLLYGARLMRGGYIILDDIEWPGVRRLWEEISHGFDSVYHKGGALFARKL